MKLPKSFQFGFQQKWVLITGAGKGTGRQITAMLHGFNAQVVALSRTESDLQSLKEEINCETIIAELSEPDAIRKQLNKPVRSISSSTTLRSPSSSRS